jgi:hypothetical protein
MGLPSLAQEGFASVSNLSIYMGKTDDATDG